MWKCFTITCRIYRQRWGGAGNNFCQYLFPVEERIFSFDSKSNLFDIGIDAGEGTSAWNSKYKEW